MTPKSAVIEAAIDLAEVTLEALGLKLDEATGEYYYDTEGVKRWVLGSGGASGNCEECEENAGMGWIPEDDVYPNIDEPPQHPNCDCTEEYKEKRVRVYV